MEGSIGKHLNIIYIINGERFRSEQLSTKQSMLIEATIDQRAFEVFKTNLLTNYGSDVEATIYINTDRQPYEFKVFDQHNQPLSKNLNNI